MDRTVVDFATDTLNQDGRLVRDSDAAGVTLRAAERIEDALDQLDIFNNEVREIEVQFETNEKDDNGTFLPTDWKKRKGWRYRPREKSFLAPIRINITPWARPKRVPKDQWLSLDSLVDEYERVGRLVVAQVALLRKCDPRKVAQLIEGTDVSLEEVAAAVRRKIKQSTKPIFDIPLDVEVVHGLIDRRGNLDLREKMRKALTAALEDENLGVYDGGSSSDEHFEFGFLVADEEQAKKRLANAMTGFDSSFEVRFFVG